MEYIKNITNHGLKKRLGKTKFNEETMHEIKTSLFIHPCIDEGNGYFSFTYSKYYDESVLELFTSLEEYYMYYKNNEDVIPIPWHFNDFEDSFLEDTSGVLINRCSDNVFIPKSLYFHIAWDIDMRENMVKFNKDFADNLSNSFKDEYISINRLYAYLKGKSSIKYIDKFYDILNNFHLFNLICSKNSLDNLSEDGAIPIRDINVKVYNEGGYVVVFTDKSLFEDINQDYGYLYYSHSDMYILTKLVLEFDYEGIILRTPDNDFVLKRHRLLKYFDKICENYRSNEELMNFVFKLAE